MKYKVYSENHKPITVEADNGWSACMYAKTILPQDAEIACAMPIYEMPGEGQEQE